ncbi:MAG TPA: Ig-like domain-containing protein, partial [Gemmataceae bacterium]|nr:Ig-like domain-containing protein [Gemmataceae bacterium]
MTRRLLGPVLVASLLATARLHAEAPKTPVAHAPGSPVETLTVFPPEITFDGPRAEQRLGVLAIHADGRQWDQSRSATYASSDPKIVSVDAAGIVRPAGDGKATVTVTSGDKSATIPVTVSKSTAEEPVNFTREIEALLTKAGCNQGACHGAQLGRGGFRLSLFGFDPAFDHSQIVQSAEGRRVVLPEPERSILLLKPSLQMEHGGGERFPANSQSYDLLRRWLA